jgi:MFS family permease
VVAASVDAAPAIHDDPQFRRLWAAGLLGSLVRWLETLAFAVFTFQQTGSAFWVVNMTMLRMLPMALFGLAVGALAARISRRTVLLVSTAALFATTLGLLVVSVLGRVEVWHLALASFINGMAWVCDMPVRRGLMGDIAGPPRMARAMALDAVATNGCRLAGPGLGGLLLAYGALPLVFLVTAVLYVPMLAALVALRDVPPAERPPKLSLRSLLSGGMQAARGSPRLTGTLCITVIFNLFGWPVLSMVPVIAQDHLRLSTQGTGLLASMDGVGSLVGALLLTALARRVWQGHVYVGGVVLFLALLPAFALSRHPLLTALVLLAIGVGQAAFAVMQSTLVYLSVPPQRRLDAMGLLTMCIGVGPVGFLFLGWLAQRFGAPAAAVTCSVAGLACVLLTWPLWRPCLRDGDVP